MRTPAAAIATLAAGEKATAETPVTVGHVSNNRGASNSRDAFD